MLTSGPPLGRMYKKTCGAAVRIAARAVRNAHTEEAKLVEIVRIFLLKSVQSLLIP